MFIALAADWLYSDCVLARTVGVAVALTAFETGGTASSLMLFYSSTKYYIIVGTYSKRFVFRRSCQGLLDMLTLLYYVGTI
jgi:hypothetical protein